MNVSWTIKLEDPKSIILLNVTSIPDAKFCGKLQVGNGNDLNEKTSLLGVVGINDTGLELATSTNEAWIKIERSNTCKNKLNITYNEIKRVFNDSEVNEYEYFLSESDWETHSRNHFRIWRIPNSTVGQKENVIVVDSLNLDEKSGDMLIVGSGEILKGTPPLFLTGKYENKKIVVPARQRAYCILRTTNSMKSLVFSVRWERVESHETTTSQEVSSTTSFPPSWWQAIWVCFEDQGNDTNKQINETDVKTLFKLEMTVIAKIYASDRNILIPEFSDEDIEILHFVTVKKGKELGIFFVIVTKEDRTVPVFSAQQLLNIIDLYNEYPKSRLNYTISSCSQFDSFHWIRGGLICLALSAFIFILIGWGKYVPRLIRHWKKILKKKGTEENEELLTREINKPKPIHNREEIYPRFNQNSGSYVDLVNENSRPDEEVIIMSTFQRSTSESNHQETDSSEVRSNLSYQKMKVGTAAHWAKNKRVSDNFKPGSTTNTKSLSNGSSHTSEDSENDEHIYEKVEARKNGKIEQINDRPTNQINESIQEEQMENKSRDHISEDTENKDDITTKL
ncbi:uncharacterized protein LOC106458514 isoform X2 [Limulus polyphemus]|nr:uncharacterized protein LOC106458514 isoform X2 [Limulus polyphemus]